MSENKVKEENIDIGFNDNEFILGLEKIRKINEKKNKNIILKLFNFYPNRYLKMIIFRFINQIFHNF